MNLEKAQWSVVAASLILVSACASSTYVAAHCDVNGQVDKDLGFATLNVNIDETAKALHIALANKSDHIIQAVLSEWSITSAGQTDSVVTANTPNGQVATSQLPTVSVPAGGTYTADLIMRSHHSYSAGSFQVAPIVPFPSYRFGSALFPMREKNCQTADYTVQLTYAVVGPAGNKVIDSLALPVHVQFVPGKK